jgi:predicted peroxiredoxin
MNMVLLFTALTIVNVILQTIKSLCTVRCPSIVSASVNAVAYGLYTFVIFFTTADGMPLWMKAAITAVANFFGVYIANFLFDKIFTKIVRWKVEVSVSNNSAIDFQRQLRENGYEFYVCGYSSTWKAYAVFCATKAQSELLKKIMPPEAKYNIVECVKHL